MQYKCCSLQRLHKRRTTMTTGENVSGSYFRQNGSPLLARQNCFCAIKMMLKTKSDNVRQCKENKSPWNLLFLVHLFSRCRAARMGSNRTPGRAFKCQIEQLWSIAELIMLIFHNLISILNLDR